MAQNNLDPALVKLIGELEVQHRYIPEERKEKLKGLAETISENARTAKGAKLIFICSHNSRRSQISELWAGLLTAWYGLEGIEAFSGGTGATAFDSRMVEAAKRAGFGLEKISDGSNPRYRLKGDWNESVLYSKKYDDPVNPAEGFIAVMVCSEADAACPVVPGAAHRISLPFEDPKIHDDSPAESQMYDKTVLDVGRELVFLFKQLSEADSTEQH